MSRDSICIHWRVRRGVYSPYIKESRSVNRKRTLAFEITNYKLRPAVSSSGIWGSTAVQLPSVD